MVAVLASFGSCWDSVLPLWNLNDVGGQSAQPVDGRRHRHWTFFSGRYFSIVCVEVRSVGRALATRALDSQKAHLNFAPVRDGVRSRYTRHFVALRQVLDLTLI